MKDFLVLVWVLCVFVFFVAIITLSINKTFNYQLSKDDFICTMRDIKTGACENYWMGVDYDQKSLDT